VVSFTESCEDTASRMSDTPSPESSSPESSDHKPAIVVGVTMAQTCLLLGSRVRALCDAGFRVTVVSSPGPLLDRLASSEKVEVCALPMARRISLGSDLISLFRLWRLLRRLKPCMVEFSTPKAGLLGMLAARIAGVPVRVYLLRGLKLETASGLKRRILLMAERLAAASADVVVCNSHSLREKALFLRIAPAAKLLVLGAGSSNGVDTERFCPGLSPVRQQLGLPGEIPVIGYVGRLTCDKGIVDLLQAFDQILATRPDGHLLLVGWFDEAEDALSASVRAQIEGHRQITVTGMVDSAEEYYRAMDVFVLPTWREGFPNVAIEAAATGIPVVTTDATGARDSVVPGVTGLLIPPGDPEAICRSVNSLLDAPDRREQMGRAARAWVLKNYTDTQVLGSMVDYYRGLI
jgi:glycosyltransferase involved in cell wall biosynthesis